jgi:hypothetical protein
MMSAQSRAQGEPATPDGDVALRLVSQPVNDLPPLTYQQERLVHVEDEFPHYQRHHRLFAVLELKGLIDLAALSYSANALWTRHDAFRFRLGRTSAGYHAIFDDAKSNYALEPEDLTLDDEAAFQYVYEQAIAPYDPPSGNVCRGRLFRLGPERHWLLLAAHHIIFDYWSMGIVVQELGAAYRDGLSAKPAPLQVVSPSIRDYAVWQRSGEFADLRERQRPFWRALLAKPIPRSELLFYPEKRDRLDYDPLQLIVSIGAPTIARTNDYARERSLTLYMVLLGAFAITLRYFGAAERLLIAAPISNRTDSRWKRLIGVLSGMVPLVLAAPATHTLDAFFSDLKSVVTGAVAHQDVQFQEFSQLAGAPLDYQFMFQIQNAPIPAFELGSISVSPVRVDYGNDCVDVSLLLTQSPDMSGDRTGLSGYFTIDKNLISEDEAHRMWAIYLGILERITGGVGGTIRSVVEDVRRSA